MKNISFYFSLVLLSLVSSAATAQTDFFMSSQGIFDSAVNAEPTVDLDVGDSGTLYLYFDNSIFPNVDTCIWFVLTTSEPDVIEITNFETFGYDILIADVDIDDRWQVFGAGTVEPDGQSAKASGFNVTSGTGMLNGNIAGPFMDEGYDATAGAFSIGRIDFEAIGSGSVNLIMETDPDVFIGNAGMQLITSYGSATVNVKGSGVLIGDVNLDGMVTLLDVAPFVDRITTGTYQAEADCNQDGLITLLDVDPFIDSIQFP